MEIMQPVGMHLILPKASLDSPGEIVSTICTCFLLRSIKKPTEWQIAASKVGGSDRSFQPWKSVMSRHWIKTIGSFFCFGILVLGEL